LKELEIYGATQLEEICHGPLAPNSFGMFTIIKVTNCGDPCVVGFSFLEGIVLLNDKYASVDSEILEFVSLKTLELNHLHKFDNFCYFDLAFSLTEYQGLESSSSALFNSYHACF